MQDLENYSHITKMNTHFLHLKNFIYKLLYIQLYKYYNILTIIYRAVRKLKNRFQIVLCAILQILAVIGLFFIPILDYIRIFFCFH